MTQKELDSSSDNLENSLFDIIILLTDAWKKLAIAALLGAALGLASWFVLGSYSAEYVLLNNSIYGLDILSWKVIQKTLPALASQIVEDGKAPEGQTGLYRTLSNYEWWQKNLTLDYAITKSDLKNIGTISKEFDSANTTILSLSVIASGPSKGRAIEAVKATVQFLQSGGAYIEILDMLNTYEGEVVSGKGEIQRKINNTQSKIDFQQKQVKSLEELKKRYHPSNISDERYVFSGEMDAKYAPITNQIIAANHDINYSKEELNRLNDGLAKIALTKLFLDEALPKIATTFDGLVLNKELLAIQEKLRDKIGKDDNKSQEVLNKINSQLLKIQVRFTQGLHPSMAPTSYGNQGMINSAIGGLAAAFILMLLVLLGQRVWSQLKSEGVK